MEKKDGVQRMRKSLMGNAGGPHHGMEALKVTEGVTPGWHMVHILEGARFYERLSQLGKQTVLQMAAEPGPSHEAEQHSVKVVFPSHSSLCLICVHAWCVHVCMQVCMHVRVCMHMKLKGQLLVMPQVPSIFCLK